jgi:magnesium transporter
LIESRQATETCGIYRDILKTTMDAFSSVISNNVNNVVKGLSIITILVSIPTLIAGLFGMNVDLPFGWGVSGDTRAIGFWIILGVAVVLTAICSILLVRMTDKVRIRTPKQIKKKRR